MMDIVNVMLWIALAAAVIRFIYLAAKIYRGFFGRENR